MRVELHLHNRATPVLTELRTNAEGRIGNALPDGVSLQVGRYLLVFHVAEYFRATGQVLAEPPFLDEVSIDFGVSEPKQNHHVPLLVTPWSYSTYRGS
jgi:5-hydroxyisourate hydrolase